ncbi:MAG: hypothetical protein Q7J25_13675 [Vicinamibacterales bacterium]|nr:hypothetical protein [Vicinamibacterales bacterium]
MTEPLQAAVLVGASAGTVRRERLMPIPPEDRNRITRDACKSDASRLQSLAALNDLIHRQEKLATRGLGDTTTGEYGTGATES